jgi:hypothetical protein
MNLSAGRAVDGVIHGALIFPAGVASANPWLQLIDLFKPLLSGYFLKKSYNRLIDSEMRASLPGTI